MEANRSSNRTRTNLVFPIFAAVCGAASALTLIVAGFGTRAGIWHFRTGLAIFKYAGYAGVISCIIAVAAIVHSLNKRQVWATIVSFAALICALVAFGLPVSWQTKAHKFPRIHDISTDLNTPPTFVALASFHPGADVRESAAVGSLQSQAYPDLKTVIMPVPASKAYTAALDTARQMGWDLVAAVPSEGRIEATDTTFWFGFKDDIVIRITPAGDRSLLDIRSVSRVGISDVGTNAKRIRTFLQKLNSQPTAH